MLPITQHPQPDRRSNAMRRHFLACLAAAVAAAALPAAAGAATATSQSGAVRFTAAPGERNALTVSSANTGAIVLTDPGTPIAPGAGCVAGTQAGQVFCAAADRVTANLGDRGDTFEADPSLLKSVFVHGQDGDDVLHGGPISDVIDGGPGNDRLTSAGGGDLLQGGTGTDTADYSTGTNGLNISLNNVFDDGEAGHHDSVADDVETVLGGSGDDVLTGNDAPNVLIGNDGDDALVGRKGADRLSGGNGRDQVSYIERTNPVTVTLDGVANDGAPGENDAIDGVQAIIGGAGADTLIGNTNPNELIGNAGNDTLRGLGDDDTLFGGADADVLDGGDGAQDTVQYGENTTTGIDVSLDGVANDGTPGEHDQADPSLEVVIGTEDDDRLAGNAKPNVLAAGQGDDIVDGKGGNDRLEGGDGNDSLTGGPGDDVLNDTGGIDTANYNDHPAGVTATIGGKGGTGAEADTIDPAIENLGGGQGDDTLNGDGGNNRLAGGPGNDRLNGFAGADLLDGGVGSDFLDGGSDVDVDVISAADGFADQIVCHSFDQLTFDAAIDIRKGC
jgi:Ca2+-binding RTX toxin-like protein